MNRRVAANPKGWGRFFVRLMALPIAGLHTVLWAAIVLPIASVQGRAAATLAHFFVSTLLYAALLDRRITRPDYDAALRPWVGEAWIAYLASWAGCFIAFVFHPEVQPGPMWGWSAFLATGFSALLAPLGLLATPLVVAIAEVGASRLRGSDPDG